jgi:hypothetical protein
MDNFTLTIIAGDILVIISLIALIVFDKGKPVAPVIEPVKTTGKRSA